MKNAAKIPSGIRPESVRNPRGVRPDSLVPYPTLPVPVPKYVPFSDRTELVQRIRTSRDRAKTPFSEKAEKEIRKLRRRLLARVLRDVLSRDRFATSADLLDAFKTRLSKLRIPYRPEDVAEAVRLVESNTAAVHPWE